jgi:hypothetical protein
MRLCSAYCAWLYRGEDGGVSAVLWEDMGTLQTFQVYPTQGAVLHGRLAAGAGAAAAQAETLSGRPAVSTHSTVRAAVPPPHAALQPDQGPTLQCGRLQAAAVQLPDSCAPARATAHLDSTQQTHAAQDRCGRKSPARRSQQSRKNHP